jgi:hypothetical protein
MLTCEENNFNPMKTILISKFVIIDRSIVIFHRSNMSKEEDASGIAATESEEMAVAGITKLSTVKQHETDLHLWKVKDVYRSPSSGMTVARYKCPLMARCKCPAMLRVTRTSSQISIDQSNMHEANSHNVDQSKFLTATSLRRQLHRTATSLRRRLHCTSPEKAINPLHARSSIFVLAVHAVCCFCVKTFRCEQACVTERRACVTARRTFDGLRVTARRTNVKFARRTPHTPSNCTPPSTPLPPPPSSQASAHAKVAKLHGRPVIAAFYLAGAVLAPPAPPFLSLSL